MVRVLPIGRGRRMLVAVRITGVVEFGVMMTPAPGSAAAQSGSLVGPGSRDATANQLPHDVADLAEAAGRLIMEIYTAEDFEVRVKSDSSPVTDADLRAESAILGGLAELTPDVPIVAEERVEAGEVPAALGARFWLVDPLDGTKEFLSRNGEFTVNIALVDADEPVLGVVHAPALDATYVGAWGGAWLRGSGGSHELTVRKPGPEGMAVLVSRSHLDPETEEWLADVRVSERVSAGSSLKFCRIAEGRADLYPRFGRTMEWDTAAGDAVLRMAGGTVREVGGERLRYGKPGFANPGFVAYGDDAPSG